MTNFKGFHLKVSSTINLLPISEECISKDFSVGKNDQTELMKFSQMIGHTSHLFHEKNLTTNVIQ